MKGVFLSLGVGFATAALKKPPSPADLDAFIISQLNKPYSDVPGIAVLVVENGKVVLRKGYGVQSQGVEAPVTEETMFGVGSVTKTFVATGLATLVDAKKLSWDDRVVDHIPGFRMHNPYVTDNLLVSDLLTHHTGLAEGQGDSGMIFLNSSTAIGRTSFLDPEYSFRQDFHYNNHGWVIAGQVLASACGTANWCDCVTQQVIDPLKLTSTFCDRRFVPESQVPNVAQVHYYDPCQENENSLISRFEFLGGTKAKVGNAAGSIVSSIADVTKLVLLLLGNPGNQVPQIASKETLRQVTAGHVTIPNDWLQESGIAYDFESGSNPGAGYGLDLSGNIFHGLHYFDKSGDTVMHKARFGALPDEGSAVFILGNLGGAVGGPLTCMKFGLLGLLTGYDPDLEVEKCFNATGYLKALPVIKTCNNCGRSEAEDLICQPSNLQFPPIAPSAFAGTYSNNYAGELQVNLLQDLQLTMSLSNLVQAPVRFDKSCAFLNATCTDLASTLSLLFPPWANATQGLENLSGWCSFSQFLVDPENPAENISIISRTTSFPWGVELPDPWQLVFISHASTVLRTFFSLGPGSVFEKI